MRMNGDFMDNKLNSKHAVHLLHETDSRPRLARHDKTVVCMWVSCECLGEHLCGKFSSGHVLISSHVCMTSQSQISTESLSTFNINSV